MRLIDADALTDYLKCLFPERGMWEINGDTVKDAICETVVEAMEMVKNMETVKPERKTGHWVCKIDKDPIGYNVKVYVCSECRKMYYRSANYCSNCGARMVEVDD